MIEAHSSTKVVVERKEHVEIVTLRIRVMETDIQWTQSHFYFYLCYHHIVLSELIIPRDEVSTRES